MWRLAERYSIGDVKERGREKGRGGEGEERERGGGRGKGRGKKRIVKILWKLIRFSLFADCLRVGESNWSFVAADRMLIRRNGEFSDDVGVSIWQFFNPLVFGVVVRERVREPRTPGEGVRTMRWWELWRSWGVEEGV